MSPAPRSRTPSQTDPQSDSKAKIWWSNALFFVAVHIAAVAGLCYFPPWRVKWETVFLAFWVWQLADFGITIGYHRLYSHKAFRASFGVRLVLAMLGSVAFQGSIKWWCLRHRLHHRYTDDPIHDPYAATRGLFYSHMGWIFFKPNYERMSLIERDDLERDPVVRFQHEYYVPLAVTLGFGLPTLLGLLWKEPLGAFVWAGLVSRLFIWHCTFLVNSLAHKDGLQPYSDEDTSRGNLILALLTGGEGNHNFHHAFPHDFRSGPSNFDWDPSKWIILLLHKIGLVAGLRQAREGDIIDALRHMKQKVHHHGEKEKTDKIEWTGQAWERQDLEKYLAQYPSACLLLLDEYIIDVTRYLGEHPGGAALLRKYSLKAQTTENEHRLQGVDWEFYGGFNNHSRAAKKRMNEMKIARLAA